MPKPVLPSHDSASYELLSLTALCGEFPCDSAPRLISSESYRKKIVTGLTHNRLLRIFSRNHLRGYRLGIRGKRLLQDQEPERFLFYLSGCGDTNAIKSEPSRRLRLHRIARTYITMKNAGITIFRDKKPPLFSPDTAGAIPIEDVYFYDSREMKELRSEMLKIYGSRMTGALFTPKQAFAVFNAMDSIPTFDPQIERRAKVMLQRVCQIRTVATRKVDGILLADHWQEVSELTMKRPSKRLQTILAVALLLYACGYLTQFIGNYAVWQKNGGMLGSTSPPFPSLSLLVCLKGILWFPYNLYCMAGCAAVVAALVLYRKLFSQDSLTDSERNFDFSAKGTYGTSGWMQPQEIPAVLDMVSDLSLHTGTVLGMLNGKYLCIPEKTRMNGNLAVYGASGSMKTRSFCMNRILQSAARGESLVICDPKSELYEKSSEYMRDLGYTVRVFNLVSPENSDSWNCLKEIEGQELMAQLFVDVIIKNTNGTGKSDRFWDSGEMNLLKALVLYVDLTYPPEQRNIGEVYNLITQCSESQLDSLFDVLPLTHPAKAPYSLYQRASDSVRSGVISGLGSRLQVFQSELIKRITAYDEISLELPGQQPCAYYLVTSDQDSTFDFLASLFLSFAFIKLVRYADATCPGGRLPVPVHILGEELTACGTISELSRRISVIRSRNISMSCVFQNLAGLQNRYPQNQWQEILGNCDVQLFLGCTDQLTAEYVSQRTGIASVMVSSTSKALNTLRVSDYTPQYRESNGIGKRPLLTPDEVLRLPVDEALVILRGHKVLKVHKMDYSLHPAYKHLRECKASAHIPEWQTAVPETPSAITPSTAPIAKTPPKWRGRKAKTVVAADKTSIMTKPENEKELSHGNEQ